MASTEISLFAYEAAEAKKEKSPNALRTISEAAEILDVPQHVLRFWETKFPQIKPLKRNGGRRFYRPQDIDILQQIKHLLYSQGYTIKGAKKAVDDYLLARTENGVAAGEWLAIVPPASVNDNTANLHSTPRKETHQFEAELAATEPAEPDMLADIAVALSQPVQPVATEVVEHEEIQLTLTDAIAQAVAQAAAPVAMEEELEDAPFPPVPEFLRSDREAPSRAMLYEMRSELMQLRDQLLHYLPPASPLYQ